MTRDEAREHIRAAQEAEIAGNKEGAVRHLERAALSYVRVGLHARAALMYRNCVRLAPERADLRDALDKAEKWAATSREPSSTDGPPIVSSEGFDALAIPRGPSRVLAGLEAWCSFCCRPTKEVGELVAGPAGAFICAECVDTSAAMLSASGEPKVAAVAPPPPKLVVVPKEAASNVTWLGPEAVILAARAALSGRGPPLVVVGAEGSGKTALLEALGAERPELGWVDLALDGQLPPSDGLLIEHLHLATPAQRSKLRGRAFVATWRADEIEAEALPVKLGEASHVFPLAAGVGLGPELGTVAAVALEVPGAELLQRLLELDIEKHRGPEASIELQALLVQRALGSGRGAKGLVAELGLLRSLGQGAALGLDGPAPKKRRRKRS